ncbi:HAD family hydrolase [Fastidiosibacter lacustris]|uniref:HAD family hydrolase n=1 Tax=Fastidiosibacter lacustris TaxID=2056695 RepID=UPI000E35093F|nr:HAD-IB family hydrolase [Fastidiosibacter lacustris]
MPNITLFDLDHTLISVDCSNEWTKYLCQQNFVNNPKAYMATKNAYARAYLEGQVDMLGFSRFILQPLIGYSSDDLQKIFNNFAEYIVNECTYPEAYHTIQKSIAQGGKILLISASIIDIVRPIGLLLGFEEDNIIGVQSIKENGVITGEVLEPLSFAEGKVYHYQQWLAQQQKLFKNSIFYSDSINDAPLLEIVDQAICINPDPKLKKLALKNGWEIKIWQMKNAIEFL